MIHGNPRLALAAMNAVVFVASGWHLGYLGCYGNPWIETPHVDRLASESIVFDQYYPENVGTLATRRSWWTGRYHFCLPTPPDRVFATRGPAMAESLSAAGVRTVFVSHAPAAPEASAVLAREFAEVIPVGGSAGIGTRAPVEERLPPCPRGTLESSGAAEVVKAAVQWLKGRLRDKPFLLWLENDDLLAPWNPPQPYRTMYHANADQPQTEPSNNGVDPGAAALPAGVAKGLSAQALAHLRQLYAGTVTLIDDGLGELLDYLGSTGELADSLVIVMSEHGMPLGERGVVGCGEPMLYEEMVHVPLIVRLPGPPALGRRTAALVQAVDIAPTLLDVLGVAFPVTPPLHGQSLVGLLRGTAESVRDCAALGAGGKKWALRTPAWHLITSAAPAAEEVAAAELLTADAPQLFIKPEDRWDVNDVANQYPEVVVELSSRLRQFARRAYGDETAGYRSR